MRNRPDGTVEAVFEGPEADVDAMVDWARQGSRKAMVDELAVISEKPVGESGFEVR